jgi:isopentenyl-diphosphate delta-isomerase
MPVVVTPRPGETVESAALRRTGEELGLFPHLKKAFVFTYQASFENGLTEHEYDHVFIGIHDGELHVDPNEVSEVKLLSMSEIKHELASNAQIYTAWFQIAFPKIEDHLRNTDYGFRNSGQ